MQNYKRLRVTARAREVIKATYLFTADFPSSEQFGLTTQMRRAAVSIALNLAEGCSRSSRREFARFLEVSRGSAMELELAVQISEDLGFDTVPLRGPLSATLEIVLKELTVLIRVVRARAD